MIKQKNSTNFPVPIIAIIALLLIFFFSKVMFFTTLIIVCIYFAITRAYIINAFKGSKAYKIEDYKTALDYYRKAVQAKHVSGPILTSYLIMEVKYGSSTKAQEYINANLSKRSFKENDYINLTVANSLVLWMNNKKDDAIQELEDLLITSKNTYIYESLSSYYVVSKRFSEAENIIKEGLEFNASSNILKSNYGEINYLLENYEEAEKTFETLVNNESITFTEPFYYYALLLQKKNNYQLAIELLEKALNQNDSLVSLVSKDKVEKSLQSITFKSLSL